MCRGHRGKERSRSTCYPRLEDIPCPLCLMKPAGDADMWHVCDDVIDVVVDGACVSRRSEIEVVMGAGLACLIRDAVG